VVVHNTLLSTAVLAHEDKILSKLNSRVGLVAVALYTVCVKGSDR
jgi:hypothetical protein